MSKRALFALVNTTLAALFIFVIFKDSDREWKRYQKGKTQGISQIIVSKLNRVDRCITCHTDIGEAHSATKIGGSASGGKDYIFKKHPQEKFGCTVCHEGQGLATTSVAAHGYVYPVRGPRQRRGSRLWRLTSNGVNWDEPMLKGVYIQGSCGKCHQDTRRQGMEALERGKRLFKELGCIGCHSVNGWGGNISVDIGEIADKPREELDFSHIKGEKTVGNWLFEHFKNPQDVTPAQPDVGVPYPSAMPNNNLSDEDAAALTALMLSYTGEAKKMPQEYCLIQKSTTSPTPISKIELGREAYYKFGCVGCHGKDGAFGISNYNAIGGKVPALTYVAEGYTVNELKDKIRKGVQPVDKEYPKGPVPPLWMQRWGERITETELDDLVSYLMRLMPEEEEKWSE